MTTIDITDRLQFDAIRCETQFSKGVAGNISEAADEIERLREALKDIQRESMGVKPPRHSWYYDRAEAALNQQEVRRCQKCGEPTRAPMAIISR